MSALKSGKVCSYPGCTAGKFNSFHRKLLYIGNFFISIYVLYVEQEEGVLQANDSCT